MDLGTDKAALTAITDELAVSMRGVRALVLVGGRADAERFREVPLAMFDVLGRSVLLRTLDRLREAGITEIGVLGDTAPLPPQSACRSCTFTVASPQRFWDEALHEFRSLSRNSECVLLVRLGPWAEVDFPAMVAEHRRQGSSILRACSMQGDALDYFVVSSSSQTEAAALLRGELNDDRLPAMEYKTSGYINPLNSAASLRTLALDAFAGASSMQPCGREIRPGVWVGKGARLHRDARIVAPAFIGDGCKVRDAVVVTRGSSLERNAEVDCASMIDNSTVLAGTRIGAGLELERSIAGLNQVHSLLRDAIVKIDDPHMIGSTTTRISEKMFSGVNWAVNFLPNVFWSMFFERKEEEDKSALASDLLDASEPVLDETPLPAESQSKTYREMAVTRRYGNE